jgi:hypothetical protein
VKKPVKDCLAQFRVVIRFEVVVHDFRRAASLGRELKKRRVAERNHDHGWLLVPLVNSAPPPVRRPRRES